MAGRWAGPSPRALNRMAKNWSYMGRIQSSPRLMMKWVQAPGRRGDVGRALGIEDGAVSVVGTRRGFAVAKAGAWGQDHHQDVDEVPVELAATPPPPQPAGRTG